MISHLGIQTYQISKYFTTHSGSLYWIMDYVLREKRDVGAIRIEVHEPVSIPPLSEPIFNLGDGWQPALGAEGEIYFKISFSGYTGLVPYAADTLFVRSDSSGNMGYIGHLKQGKGVISIEEKEWIRVSESCRMEWTGEDYGTGKDRWRSYCEGEFYFGTEEMAFAPLAKDFWPQLMPYSPTNPHRLVALNISTPTWVFLTGFGPIWFSLSTDMQERIGQRLELSEAFVGGRMYTAWAAGTGIKLEGWGEIKRRFHHPKNSF